ERFGGASRRHQPLRRLYVRVGGRIIPVAVEKILHCEARGDYVALHTAEGCYVVNTSVEYLAERLSPESFVRIHRSRIVNLEAVEAFERHDDKRVRARLTNGAKVVARRAWSRALRGVEAGELIERQLARRLGGIDPRLKQGFVRVNVPDAGDAPLVHDRLLDRGPRPLEALGEHERSERLVQGLRPEAAGVGRPPALV